MRTGVDGTHGLTPLTVPPTVSRVFKAGLLVIERQRKDRTLNNSPPFILPMTVYFTAMGCLEN